jgi:adenylate cyclase
MALLRVLPDNIRVVLGLTLAGTVVGIAHGRSDALAAGFPLWSLGGIARGAFTGALITVILASFEMLKDEAPAMARLRQAPFLAHLAVKTLVYLAVILFGVAAGAWLWPTPSDTGSWLPVARSDILFSIAVAFVFNFVLDMTTLLGRNVLLDFVTGRYHRPRVEERIFLFMDMENSTALAERLGPLAFHRLVSRFIVDLTAPVAAAKGQIHRYVGDELIATWTLANGVAEARCVRACFGALDRLASLAPDYVRDFGTAVTARAALHRGPVVAGEMGSVKKEIVFLGDTVNTTARIEELCRQTGNQVLASAALVELLELPPGIAKRPLGELRLRGKQQDVPIYALEDLRRANAAAAA